MIKNEFLIEKNITNKIFNEQLNEILDKFDNRLRNRTRVVVICLFCLWVMPIAIFLFIDR